MPKLMGVSRQSEGARRGYAVLSFGYPNPKLPATIKAGRPTIPVDYRLSFSEDFWVGVRKGYSPGQQPKAS
jgi:hypothetical protein